MFKPARLLNVQSALIRRRRPTPTSPGHPSSRLHAQVLGLPPNPGTTGIYRIGPQDLLKVEVFRVDELSSKERVSQDGSIVMPLIGPVMVGGLTPKEAEDRITEILRKD